MHSAKVVSSWYATAFERLRRQSGGGVGGSGSRMNSGRCPMWETWGTCENVVTMEVRGGPSQCSARARVCVCVCVCVFSSLTSSALTG